MNNFLTFIATILVLILAALFFGPSMVDWNEYRGQLEGQMSQALGVDAQINGTVNVKLLPRPILEAHDITILNKDDADQYLRAKKIVVGLAVPPLLQGKVESNHFVLKDPHLNVELQKHGAVNWAFGNSINQIERVNLGPFHLDGQSISLRQIIVENGTVQFHNSEGKPLVQFHKINGHLSADTLRGPFGFDGAFRFKDALFKLVVATQKPDGNGKHPLTMRMQDIGRNLDVNITGMLQDFAKAPLLNGQLKITRMGKIAPLKGTLGSDKASSPVATKPRSQQGGAGQYGMASFRVDANALVLRDIKLAVSGARAPHNVKGQLTYRWMQDALTGDMQIGWLALDKKAVPNVSTAAPFAYFANFMKLLPSYLPDTHGLQLKLGADHIAVGGRSVEKLSIDLQRDKNGIELRKISAQLPGNGHLSGRGKIIQKSKTPHVTTQLWFDGDSLSTLASWGLGRSLGRLPFIENSSGAYSIGGDMSFDTGWAISNLNGSIGDTKLVHGGVSRSGKVNAPLDLDLQLSKLQLGGREQKDLNAMGLTSLIQQELKDFETHFPSLVLNARLGAPLALIGAKKLRDFHVSFAKRNDTIEGAQYALGLSEGQLKLSQSDNHLVDRELTLTINSTKGLKELAQFFPSLEPYLQNESHKGLLPIKLLAQVGPLKETSFQLDISAHIAGSVVNMEGSVYEGETGQPRVDMIGVGQNKKGYQLVAQILPLLLGTSVEASDEQTNGNLHFTVQGSIDQVLQANIHLSVGDLVTRYEGALALRNDQGTTKGRFEYSDKTIGVLNRGRHAKPHSATQFLKITSEVTRDKGAFFLDKFQVSFGEDQLEGTAHIAPMSDSPLIIKAKTNKLQLLSLLSHFLDLQRRTTSNKKEAGETDGRDGEQNDPPFVAKPHLNLGLDKGHISLEAAQLLLPQGTQLNDATIDFTFERDEVSVETINGKALGGEISAKGVLRRYNGVYSLSGDAKLQEGDLSRVLGEDQLIGSGVLSGNLKFAGQSPIFSNLADVLSASGTIELRDGQLHIHNTDSMREIIKDSLLVKSDQRGDLEKELDLLGARQPLPVSHLNVPVQISAGEVKLNPIQISSLLGKVTGDMSYALSSHQWRANWRYHFSQDQLAGRIPAISISYQGKKDQWLSRTKNFKLEQLKNYIDLRSQELLLKSLSNKAEALDASAPQTP